MIISTKRGTPAAELDKIIREFEAKGLSVTMIRGTDYNVFGLVGDTTVIDEKQVRANPYVENVQRVSEPYKKANRLFHEADSIIDVGGIKVGMAAYTYATSEVNGRPSLNYEPEVAQVGLVNYFVETNLDAFYSEMQSLLSQMRSDGAEATMLYIHWGTEYSLQADSSQRMIAQKLCDLGVDVIVGGHPHVVEPMELLTSSSDSRHKTAVIYSLGNAVSNQRRDLMTLNTGHTEDGAVFTVTFEKYADGGVYVADVNVMPTWVNLHSVDEKQEYNIVPLEDARRTEWQNLYGLDAAALANAVASYDRTMNIVGPGLEQCRNYYAQEKQARETPVVPTEEAA